jgi:hypothetical protein
MKFPWVFCLLLGLVGRCVASDEISLVRVGEVWRYFRAGTEPSDPATAWRTPGFDDSAWAAGRAGFSTAGIEATPLGANPLQRTLYLRKTFTLASRDAIRWLVFRADYDGGFVVYLNGTEIVRRGLTDDPVPYNALAAAHPRGSAEEMLLPATATNLLQTGTNLLAVQLHPSAANPTLITLVPELLANFQRGPLLGNLSSNRVNINWRTPVPTDGRVDYGLDPANLEWSVSHPSLSTNHTLTLTGLAPATDYYYRVSSSNAVGAALSPVIAFRTLKAAGDVCFALLGDSGYGSFQQFDVADVLARSGADLVLHTGDIEYNALTYGQSDTRCLSVYGGHMRSVPYFFTIGNHDMYSVQTVGSDAPYVDTFDVPVNTATGTKHFYSFDHGDVHFASLYVPTLTPFAASALYGLSVGSVQYNWLTNDLAHSAKPWKILFFHSPLISSSLHRYDDFNTNGRLDGQELREILLPVAQKYGVQLVLSGHDHNYERFCPTNGLFTVISGGGGASLYGMSERDEASAQFYVTHHCLRVNIKGDQLALEAIDRQGQTFDTMTIQRTPPPNVLRSSAWHTVAVDDLTGAPDGDGNLEGQRFEFTGTPIPAPHGEFSNLGQVYVNNDANYIYIGFTQAMIRANNEILLFVQGPVANGLTLMADAGNNLVDPQGQGADGLDLLHTLAFVNFRPSIGCLLGDEHADGQARSFQRPGLTTDTGQGIYHLNAELSDVAGARLQQFNLARQSLAPGLNQGYGQEANADFIEVAIPYSALEGAQPGATIKIGAVVAGPFLDTDGMWPQRDLDTGYLGARLVPEGGNTYVLEGLTVQLADYPPGFDGDGDGLPDRWEVDNGLNPRSTEGDDGADGDPDLDGFANRREYLAGTAPRNGDSRLRTQLQRLPGGVWSLTWPSVPGRVYQVEVSTNATGAFAPVNAPGWPRPATNTVENFSETLPGHTPTRIYRVRTDGILP